MRRNSLVGRGRGWGRGALQPVRYGPRYRHPAGSLCFQRMVWFRLPPPPPPVRVKHPQTSQKGDSAWSGLFRIYVYCT